MKNKLDTDCLNCFNKLFCTVNGSHCYSKSIEITWKASEEFKKGNIKNHKELVDQYHHIESKRNCNVSYSPIKGLYDEL